MGPWLVLVIVTSYLSLLVSPSTYVPMISTPGNTGQSPASHPPTPSPEKSPGFPSSSQHPPGLGSRRGDGSVSLQASCVPDLCLDGSGAQHYSAGGELNPDGGAAVVAEFIAGEPGQQIGLAHA